MSVINEVLNQLEQRGAPVAGEQSMVRSVPVHHHRRTFWLAVALAVLLLGGAVALWRVATKLSPPAVKLDSATKPTPSVDVVAEVITSEARGLALPASRLSFELSHVPAAATAPSSVSNANIEVPRAPNPVLLTHSATSVTPALSSMGDPPLKQISSAQRADAEFRKAASLMQQGRINDALAGYRAALQFDPSHAAARQALVVLLLEAKRADEAEQVLQAGLKAQPENSGLAMLLARVQVARADVAAGLQTLSERLSFADKDAEYQAFYAALLQRQNRHAEALQHYQVALALQPHKGIWLMGYGLSLQALARTAEAKVSLQQALETQSLSPALEAFVQQKIKAL